MIRELEKVKVHEASKKQLEKMPDKKKGYEATTHCVVVYDKCKNIREKLFHAIQGGEEILLCDLCM